ncbi:hypothetical protein ABZ468_09945 [Streptomyces sp. NPDC005708]|uniref:hypothetical protein n=1 Tax=unclassified Streptomyces TaxID=2593676 RepID=UPI0033D0FE42
MIIAALLIPVSMLCLVLALGRYEERMLGPGSTPEPKGARHARTLRAVPDPSPDAGPQVPTGTVAEQTGRTTPGDPGVRRAA